MQSTERYGNPPDRAIQEVSLYEEGVRREHLSAVAVGRQILRAEATLRWEEEGEDLGGRVGLLSQKPVLVRCSSVDDTIAV